MLLALVTASILLLLMLLAADRHRARGSQRWRRALDTTAQWQPPADRESSQPAPWCHVLPATPPAARAIPDPLDIPSPSPPPAAEARPRVAAGSTRPGTPATRPSTGGTVSETSSRAWTVRRPGPVETGPLGEVVRPPPAPGPGEVRVRVSACGVCRTDLHLAEGDLPPRRPGVTPGHEVVGRVDALGPGAGRFAVGERIGFAWLRSTCGTCRWCRRGAENLCPHSTYTGWDADGGFAEYAVGREAFAYRLPDRYDDVAAAPLLCAGIVGYRALRRAELPPGGTLGLYGFGASAHLVAQVALAQGARVHVRTRAPAAQELALELGVDSAAGAADPVPEPLDSAVLFAPAGELVLPALAALDRGGTLSVAGIHLTDIPRLDYARHLFQERQLRSVTSSTRADGEEFLALADRIPLRIAATRWPLGRADEALRALARDEVRGVAVLTTA